MAFARDNIEKMELKSDQYNNTLEYMLNVPGTGTKPDYIVDPQVRLQKFGANLSVNVVDINSKLLGVNKQLNRDHFVENTRDSAFNDTYKLYTFPEISTAITDQPRSTMPAWELRGLEQNNWNYLPNNPQNHTEILFVNNVNSRLAEKDIYTATCGI